MAKKENDATASEMSIPAGMSPELDRALGQDSVKGVVLSTNLSIWPNVTGSSLPGGISPVFNTELSRDGLDGDLPAADFIERQPGQEF